MKAKLLLAGALGLLATLRLAAVNPVPLTEAVSFTVRLSGTATGTLTLHEESPTAPSVGHSVTGADTESTATGLGWLRPGKEYKADFHLVASAAGEFWLSFMTPPGYALWVEGQPTNLIHQSVAGAGTYDLEFDLRLIPAGDSGAAAVSVFSGIELGRAVTWDVGLGAISNGKAAGRLVFKEKDLTNSPASRARLYYAVPTNYGSIQVITDGGSAQTLRQVGIPEALVDLRDEASGGYSIRFYGWGTGIEGSPGNPYIIYASATLLRMIRVESPAAGQMKITETEGTGTRVSHLTLSSGTVSSGTYTWTFQEGDGTAWLRTTTYASTQASGYREAVVRVHTGNSTADGALAAKSKYRFEDPGWGEELIKQFAYASTSTSDNDALTTTYAYHAEATQRGNYRRTKSVTFPSGDWTAWRYYDDWDRRGQLKYEFHPYLDAPASPVDVATESAADTAANSTTGGRVIYFTYTADWTGRHSRPTLRQEKVNNVVTAKTTWSHGDVVGYGWPREYSTAYSYRDSANSQADYSERLRGDAGLEEPFLPYARKGADQAQDSWAHRHGAYNPSTKVFTANDEPYYWRQIVVHGSTNSQGAVSVSSWEGHSFAPVYVIPGRSTLEATIRDAAGKVLRTERYVYQSSGTFARIGWVDFTYWPLGRLAAQVTSANATIEHTYTNGRLTKTVGADATETQFTHDGLGRVATMVKKGVASATALLKSNYSYPAQSDVTTTNTYDGADHVTQQVVASGSLSLTSSAAFDLVGRATSQTAPGSYTTSYSYALNNREVTVTLPGGATKTSEVFRDGSPKLVSGTAVVAENHSYWIEADGRRARQSYHGGLSAGWTNTYWDWLGRKVEEWRPGWNGNNVGWTWSYNASGQLWKATAPGVAATLYAYDTLGRRTSEGLDVGGNDALDAASADRLRQFDAYYATSDGGTTWKLVRTEQVLATTGSATATTVSTSSEQLTGLPAGRIAASTATDQFGNTTARTTDVDRTAKRVVTTTDLPDSTTNDVQVVYNGLTVETQDRIGVIRAFEYDALGRQNKAIDPRTGATTTAYKSGSSQIDWVKDPADVAQATYTYNPAGLVATVTNALGKVARYEYNARGQKTREWGDTTYPVEYGYDTVGRQTTMSTYRSGSGWTGTAWPSASTGTADTTAWAYHQATGLLQSKTDANSKAVTYTYTQAGQIATRTWARGIVTTYAYSSTTGELTNVSYSDNYTPPLTYTYNRLGLLATVQDYTSQYGWGQRAFNYNLSGTLELSSEDLSAFYANRRLTYGYDTTGSGTKGRLVSASLGTSGNPSADQLQTLGYQADGRLNAVAANAAGYTNYAFQYNYLQNSHLIQNIYQPTTNSCSWRAFDEVRDALSYIDTTYNGNYASVFEYYWKDNLGRISYVHRYGAMFNQYELGALRTHYTYNDRSEVTSEITYLDWSSTVLTGRNDTGGYAYDNLGNRTASVHNGNSSGYTTNALNQYTALTVPGMLDVAGAAGTADNVYVNGVAPTRHGEYFFLNFLANGTSSARSVNSMVGVTPQVKSINGVYSFNWQNQAVSTPTVTGPNNTSVQVLEFGGTSWCAGIEKDNQNFPNGYYYTFQNTRTYSFGFWARTTSGTRSIKLIMTDDVNTGQTTATHAIDTAWKWVTVTKTYSSVGARPRLFYNWDGGGVPFQVYGAQISDITEPTYGSAQPGFLPGTPRALTYDLDGNLTEDGRLKILYDAENRPSWIQTSDTAAAAGIPYVAYHIFYDYLGRRVIRHPYAWNGTTWVTSGAQERYIYRGWNLIARLDDGVRTRNWFWGLDLSGSADGAGGVGGLLLAQDGGQSYFPAYDALGNIHAMIRASDGALAACYEYDAFGQTIRETGTYAAANPFRFSTKYTDIETSLVYYGTRYYSPSLGRFLNRDSIGEQGGVNLYAFVNNNPVNRWDYLGMVDPKGLQACDGVWKPRNLTEAWDNQIDQFAFVKEADWNMTGTGFARNQYRVTMSDGTSMVVHANSATEASDIARDRAGSTPATGFLQAYSNIINAGGVSTGLPGASSTAPNSGSSTQALQSAIARQQQQVASLLQSNPVSGNYLTNSLTAAKVTGNLIKAAPLLADEASIGVGLRGFSSLLGAVGLTANVYQLGAGIGTKNGGQIVSGAAGMGLWGLMSIGTSEGVAFIASANPYVGFGSLVIAGGLLGYSAYTDHQADVQTAQTINQLNNYIERNQAALNQRRQGSGGGGG